MERDGLTKIISNPRLFIIDNEQASITDGVQIPYPVAGTGANQITYEFKDAALKLDVKPSIVGDGNIYIEVIVNKDSPNYTTNPPAIDKREVKTKLLIKDGGVAMIGGINSATINSTDNQVPILGSIPFLGNLFKNTAQGNDRRQLYIFLAPSAL
jgi:type IV pilus assembly protein PilQ